MGRNVTSYICQNWPFPTDPDRSKLTSAPPVSAPSTPLVADHPDPPTDSASSTPDSATNTPNGALDSGQSTSGLDVDSAESSDTTTPTTPNPANSGGMGPPLVGTGCLLWAWELTLSASNAHTSLVMKAPNAFPGLTSRQLSAKFFRGCVPFHLITYSP